MEENKVDLEMFLNGYENVQKQINEMGGLDKTRRIEALKKEIEKAEKEISKINGEKGKKLSVKEFEAKSKPFMEVIRDSEAEIHKLERMDEEIRKDPEKLKKFQELTDAKKSIRENARKHLENKSKDIAEKVLKPKRDELKKLKDEYDAILDEEIKDPKKVRDEKYKEFLAQKISKAEADLKLEIKNATREMNGQYRELLKNFGRIDRGEKIVKTQTREEKEAEAKKREEEAKYNKDWEEAIKENDRRDKEKYDKDWEEAIKENERRDEEKRRKELMEKDIIDTEISDPSRKKDLPYDIEVRLGRKGQIVYDGKVYKIPRRALKDISNLDNIDIKMLIEDANIEIKEPELLTQALKGKAIDYAVIKGICSAKRMDNTMRVDILNTYLKECMQASEFQAVKNSCNVVYDLNDLSKLGGMDEMEKHSFLERARKAERFNTGEQIGEYKPNFWARAKAKLMGRDLKQLSGMTIEQEEEVARRADQIMYKQQTVSKNRKFVNELKQQAEVKDVDFGKYKNKDGYIRDGGTTELDDNQVKEVKEVVESQMSNLLKDDDGR